MKRLIALTLLAATLVGCSDADMASHNLSKAADNFEIQRRIVFYNGITGEYMLVIEGRCSLSAGKSTTAVAVTCKTGPQGYKKHILGLSDNVTYVSEQVESQGVSVANYRVVFKPSVLLPDIEVR